jgi:hypothetical protein
MNPGVLPPSAQPKLGPIWFLAGGPTGTVRNLCVVPGNVSVFFPIVNIINDYPCPPPFEPAPGQPLKDFLTAGATWWIDQVTDLKVKVDGYQLHEWWSPLNKSGPVM